MRSIINACEQGFAALIALIMIAMLTLLGLAVLSTSDDELSIATNELQELKAFYAADAGLEQAAALLHAEYDSTGMPPLNMPTGSEIINNSTVTFATTDDGPAAQRKLTSGTMAGLNALVKSFTMSSTAANAEENVKVTLSQSFEAALVPIFQFAVFYSHDLWTQPGPQVTITGRVHVNGNMYLQCSDKLFFNGRVTAAGEVHHGCPGLPLKNGGVYFKDRVGLYQNMYRDGVWLDYDHPQWYDSAAARWAGNVADEAFGEEEINLPLANASQDPHKMIERSAGNPDSYEEKATFKVIDGVPLAKIGGIWQDVSAMLPVGTITSTSFYDDREDQWVNSTDIDVDKLHTSGYFPSNGVLYASDQNAGFNGTRLTNGTNIGSPLTIYCENPVYFQGDYNTTNKQPAAVVADAVTFLSNDWDDTKSGDILANRVVTQPAIYNVSFITGDREPEAASYGGGLANLPRYLESWNSKQVTIRGSMVALWRSQWAVGLWQVSGPNAHYTAPTRDYQFDTDLNDPNNLPPETPVVRVFQRIGWKQSYVGYDED